MKKNKLQIWLPLLLSAIMVAGMTIGYKLRKDTVGANSFLENKQNTAASQVLDIINKMYVDNVNTDSLQTHTINNILAQLDPHSTYVTAQQLRILNDETKGNFKGIGIGFELINDSVYITDVTKNGPAEKAGVHVGDIFLSFNDTIAISGNNRLNLGVVNILRELNNSVKVKIYRSGKTFETKIEKAILPISSIDAAYMLNAKTAYIRLNKFSEITYSEFMQSLDKLKAKGMQQLIIDLRGNTGGVLTAATQIVNEFLKDNQLIVYTEGSKVGKKEYRCKRDGFYPDLKLEVLIDETSASASEIVAGALQDWDRATIVGRRSYGKGLVENQFRLNNGAALRLTVARYFTPLGRNIQKPYKNYKEKLAARFHDGETFFADTSSPEGKAFKTPNGHIVYGGGGITPDVFVPYDSTILPKPSVDLFLKGTLTKFAFLYYVQHISALQTFKTPFELANNLQPDDALWRSLSVFAQKDSIDLSQLDEKAKSNILQKFVSFVAKDRFGSEGYFEINNRRDDVIKKAIETLAQ
ncbi:hypothetical protein A9P82_08285 [Arachidicoccus ginsenosidimutans]|uniref:S41 family peptidase n=1 Tax=Arachidicoccus sp. BS20 TaxID=1850526 RepID=UPI0007F11934|nr:S41 family peptidase [Arachidicoccus sp. BS20]ANI89288.1 hypothetical protein A9P82_08285 [Arachidicoccus sp. BS20]